MPIESVTIFNLLGQELLNKGVRVANYQLDVNSLSSGAYLIRVRSEGRIEAYKFVKQ